MKWEYVRYGEERYHDESGKILASVHRLRDEVHAMIGNESLGMYIDIESAKKAVEGTFCRLGSRK